MSRRVAWQTVPLRELRLRATAPWFATPRWLAIAGAIVAALAVGLLTFPPPTGAVSATIDGSHPPDPSTHAMTPTFDDDHVQLAHRESTGGTARQWHPVTLPASMALGGSPSSLLMMPIPSSGGDLPAPTDRTAVGWWMPGQRSGAPARAVVIGHVASPMGGGASAALDELRAGDPIRLTDATGAIRLYQVTLRRELAKTEFESAYLVHAADATLLLMDCSGREENADSGPDCDLVIAADKVAG